MALRWGFLGPGRIAATVADDVPGDHVRHAVASRSLERAEAFAAEHGFARAYGSYAELLADPDVDVVYVATPHAQHHLVTSAVVAAGKPVLVEKSLTVSAAAAQDLVRQVREAGVFAMEAMWTRFVPATVRLRELVADGVVGELRQVHADLGFRGPEDLEDRLWDPAQGGGALLDLGVYPVSFAQMLLGTPTAVAAAGTLGPTGVDAEVALVVTFEGGTLGLLSCTLLGASPGRATVIGSLGSIVVEPRFHHATRLVVSRTGAEPEVVDVPLQGRGYGYQLQEVARCLEAGLTESPVMPLDDTLAVMGVLDDALEQLGGVHVDEGFTAS